MYTLGVWHQDLRLPLGGFLRSSWAIVIENKFNKELSEVYVATSCR